MSLLQPLKKSWESTSIQQDLRVTNIRPVTKSGKDPQKLDSCRPISLTSTIGRVMKRLVTNRIRYEAETRRLISEKQAGFQNGCSKEDQLFLLSTSISDDFQCSPMKRTVLTHIDYSRANDRVWQDALLPKMLRKGVSLHLTQCIQAWLANLQSWVTIEGAKSKKAILKQGVQQRSVQSPLLFLFYIADLHWGSGDLHISPFADDVMIWSQDSKLHIAEKRLQQGLDMVTA